MRSVYHVPMLQIDSELMAHSSGRSSHLGRLSISVGFSYAGQIKKIFNLINCPYT